MVVRVATVSTFEQAADAVVNLWSRAGRAKVLRFEGFDGVGKSGLAKLVTSRIGGEHIEGDTFAFEPNAPTPYPGCLRRAEFNAAITAAIASGKPLLLDAVCLEEVAPSETWGRGFVVYVKRLSFNNPDPVWHDGYRIEDKLPDIEPARGIVLYHKVARPHDHADLIIELPNEGHRIWQIAFDRGRCLDPPDAEIIPAVGSAG